MLEALHALTERWAQHAVELRGYGHEATATTLERSRKELLDVIEQAGNELLNLTQAAAASGYTADHIGRQVRAGRLKNHGRPKAPRVRRADLPKKVASPCANSDNVATVAVTAKGIALAVANR
jgi:hypothetical protein